MLWLLPYVGWTLAASAVASAAGYAAVTQFSVVQRVLAMALDRALSKLAKSEDGTPQYTIKHTGTGVIVTGVAFARAALAAAQAEGTRLSSVSIQRLEVDFPSLSSPVKVRIHGVRATLQQLQLPEHISPEVRTAAVRAQNRDEKKHRLEVIEELLWGASDGKATARRWNPAGAYLGRLQARALQKSLAFVTQLLYVEVTDVEVQYTQRGEPGPRPAANYLQGADAAVLQLRSVSLMPHFGAGHRRGDVGEDEGGEGWGGEAAPSMKSPRTQGGGGGAAAAVGVDEPTWWAALGSLPHLLWSNVVISRPSSTKLSVNGVSLTLKTYPSLWQGYYQMAAAAAAADARHQQPSTGPFRFVSEQPGSSPGMKRRRKGDAARTGMDSAQFTTAAAAAAQPPPTNSSAAKTKTTTTTASSSSTNTTSDGGVVSTDWIDYAAALHATPAESHVIFRQWECSIVLCLLPPGYENMEVTTPAVPVTVPIDIDVHPNDQPTSPPPPPSSAFQAAAEAAVAAVLPETELGSDAGALQHPRSSLRRRTSSGFGSIHQGDGDGDRRSLEHIVSGGFEEYDDEGIGLMDDDDDDLFPAQDDQDLRGAASSAMEIQTSARLSSHGGGSEYGTPTGSQAASRHSSRAASPERASSSSSSSAAAAALPTASASAAAAAAAVAASHARGEHAKLPPFVMAAESEDDVPSTSRAAATPSTSSLPPPPPPSAPATATTATTTTTAHGGGGAFTIDLAVSLKALILEMNCASTAIINRLVDRQLHFVNFGEHWATRPEVPVSGNEALWWQHGGRALASRTRRLVRREVPLSRLELRRAARLEYQTLYAGTRVSHRHFAEPGRRWWQMNKVRAPDDAARRRLEEFEEALSLEELSHFRFGVAAIYNRLLTEDEPLLHVVADKVDALVYTRRGGLDGGLVDLLLHRDRSGAGASCAHPSTAAAAAAATDSTTRFGIQISLSCPKIGVAVDMRPSSLERAPANIKYVVLCVRQVSAELDMNGSISLQVDSLDCGHSAVPTGELDPRIIASPSSVCERICRASEFTRYAITGDVLAQSSHSGDGDAVCARVSITPRYGTGGLAVGDTTSSSSSAAAGFLESGKWQPAGFDIDVRLAAVGLVYNGPIAVALLGFVSSWDVCSTKPWAWSAAPSAGGGGGSSGGTFAAAPPTGTGTSNQWPPALPSSPISIDEMVETAFATDREPVLGRLVLPSTSLVVHCPGVAIQLPYRHKNSADLFRASGRRRATRRLNRGEDESEDAEVSARAQAASTSATTPTTAAAAAATPAAAAAAAPSIPAATRSEEDGMNGDGMLGITHEISEDYDPEGVSGALIYMFTVTLQNIVVNVQGEDFDLSLRGGTARRIEAAGHLDVFSYLSRASRRVLARHIMPTRVLFDPTNRRFTEEVAGVDALEQELREIEIAAMAKVWAYPEDMPMIMKAFRAREGSGGSYDRGIVSDAPTNSSKSFKRSPSFGLDAASGLAQIMPELLKSPNQYPMPLLPYLKVGAVRGNLVQRLTAAPDEPGGAVLASASSVFAVQAWVSPLHVWHLMSLEATVRMIKNYLLGSSFVESVVEQRKAEAAAAAEVHLPQLPVPRPRRRLLVTFEVQEVSLLWLIGTWTSKGQGSAAGDPTRYSRAWGITVKRGDPAYLWAQWLAPVYGVSLAKIGAAFRYHPNGAVVAGASVDGVIVRDLQLPDGAKHAYVLRPLPARARRLNAWLQGIRRQLLGVVPVSKALVAWQGAYRTILLRQRTSLAHTNALLQDTNESALQLYKNLLLGPQLGVWYKSTPGAAGGGGAAALGLPKPHAELRVEVGQMLAYVRVKQQASMTAFAQQLTQIAAMITSDSSSSSSNGSSSSSTGPSKSGQGLTAPAAPSAAAAASRGGPSLQSGLRVDIVIVGVDVLFRVESRDLMALKLQQGVVTLDRKAVTTKSGPKDIKLHISASVQDIMVQDMRAAPEHTLVLIPNAEADYCSFDAIYTAQVDSRRYAPCLILEMNNPRVMLLFRFVADILNAVDIINGAVTKRGSEQATAAAAPPPPVAMEDGAKPLEIFIQLQNAGIIIPTATTTRTVIAANLDHIMFAVPGTALPPQLLHEANLPSLESIVEESILSNVTYRYGGFHDAPDGSGGVAEPPAKSTAAAAAATTEKPTVETGAAGPHATEKSKNNTAPAQGNDGGIASTASTAPDIKRGGFFGRVRERNGNGSDGVLFFEDDYGQRRHTNQAGVLLVDLSSGQAQDHLMDSVLAAPAGVAKHVATATKQFVVDLKDVFDPESSSGQWQNLPPTSQHQIVIDHSSSSSSNVKGDSRESTAGAAAAGGAAAASSSREAAAGTAAVPAVPVEHSDADASTSAPPPVVETEAPTANIAFVIEELTLLTGTLVRVPNYFRQGGRHGAPNPLQGSFVPASLISFSWPSEIYEVVPRSSLLEQTNLCLVLFDRHHPGKNVVTSQMHISTTPLTFILSGPNYTTLMDFVGGNLRDLLDRPSSSGAPPPSPPPPKEVHFNSAMKFGPPPGMIASFRFTLAVPQLNLVLEAPAEEWSDPVPVWDWVPAANSHLLRPFFHVSTSNLLVDLGSLPTGDLHINFCATSLDLQDLRMGYRLADISAKVPQDVEYEVELAPRPLQRFGVPEARPEPPPRSTAAMRAAVFTNDSSSEYGSPSASPHSASSFESAGDTPYTPDFNRLQGPGHNVAPPTNTTTTTTTTFESGVGGGNSGGSTRAQLGAGPRSPSGTDSQHQQQQSVNGIHLSVSRRLSEHSHQRQRMVYGPESTSNTPGTPGGVASPRHYLPVLDFGELPEVKSTLGEDVASLRVLSAPHRAPPEERTSGTASTRLPGSNHNVRLEISVAVLADKTTAVEVALSSGLLQWPYFQDLSLIWSIANVFKSAPVGEREAAGDDAPSLQLTEQDPGPSSWLYLNVVLTEMEFFLPVLDAEVAEHMAAELWGEAHDHENELLSPIFGATSSANNNNNNNSNSSPRPSAEVKNSFQRIADLALATMLLDSTSAPGALALEERGLALNATVLRFSYAAGGDGDTSVKIDLREVAAFIRDPLARINCILQPFSCSVEVNSQLPEAAEYLEIERLNKAAIVIQRQWRRYSARQALRTRISQQSHGILPAVANLVIPKRSSSSFNRTHTSSTDENTHRGRQWKLVDELVMDVASPHTRSLLQGYKRASRDRSQLVFLSQFMSAATTVVRIKAGALTARAAFSHIPFWQTAVDGVQRVILGGTSSSTPTMSGGGGGGGDKGSATPAHSSGGRPATGMQQQQLASSGGSGGSIGNSTSPSPPPTKLFKPHSIQVSATLQHVAAVLCNDKPETFGAPDVLQITFCEATIGYDAATMLPDRPANKAARVVVSTYASFLNSGTSRWEPLYDLWPVTAEFVDIKSPMYLSDRKMNLWISSDRHLNATFNPASLMSLGDALAFMRSFQDRESMDEQLLEAAALPQSPTERRRPPLTSFEDVRFKGGAAATVATTGAGTSRAPQKYLIQNQSGMRLYYWTGTISGRNSGRTPVFTLDNGGSETLRVAPITKRLNFLQSSSTATGVERVGSVIDLHFEGNWMPIRDVAVNVVGKYRYSMVSPADNTSVPLVVDIILVGRTKIITLHSGIWVENSIARPVSLRLHVPTTPLVPPQLPSIASPPPLHAQPGTEGDMFIGPLEPKSGCYLPLTAALGGRLFLQPQGYQEASRDVIRLSSDVDQLTKQQGYVTCEPLNPLEMDDTNDDDPFLAPPNGPLHVAMEATRSRIVSEFQAFKHMECVAPGTIQRASTPIEITISIQPTMVISNALPYEMRVLLWQVAPPVTTPSSSGPDFKLSRRTKKKYRKMGRPHSPSTPHHHNAAASSSAGLPAVTPGTQHHTSLLEMLSPRSSAAVPLPRRGSPGQYFCYCIPPGGEQDVHVDLRQNVLMHVSVEEINMRSTKWSLCSWAQRPGWRHDSRDSHYATARLPKEVQLRLIGVGMALPMDQKLIAPYLLRLKDVGSTIGAVHRQFNKDARIAVTTEDVQAAVGRAKAFARRMSKVSSLNGRASSSQQQRQASMKKKTSQPVPPRPGPPPLVSPPPTDGGIQKKRRSWMLTRWSRTRSMAAATESALQQADSSALPPRPHSAQTTTTQTSSTTTASPERVLLPAYKPSSSSDDASLPPSVVTAKATTAAGAPTARVTVEMVPQNPPVAAAAVKQQQQQQQPRAAVVRPPPLEISELPLVDDGGAAPFTGLAPTPFDVYKPPSFPAGKPDSGEEPDPSAEEEAEQGAEVRAPPVLHVGVYNSLSDQKLEQAGVCRVTLFAPYWLNNRTGVDLFYQDYSSAPTFSLLCGSSLPGDFGEVFIPGTSMTELFEKEGSEAGTAHGSQQNVAAGATASGGSGERERESSIIDGALNQAVLEYKLVLMNKQEELGLGLGHVSRRKYGAPVPIKTVGNKGSIELRGPPARELTATEKMEQGLKAFNTAALDKINLLRPPAAAAAATTTPGGFTDTRRGGKGTAAAGAEDSMRSMTSRHSITGDRVANVVSKEPGTMLVRLTSSKGHQGQVSSGRRRVTVRRSSIGGDSDTGGGGNINRSTTMVVDETTAVEGEAAVVMAAAPQPPPPLAGARSSTVVLDADAQEAFEAMQLAPMPSAGADPLTSGGGGGAGNIGTPIVLAGSAAPAVEGAAGATTAVETNLGAAVAAPSSVFHLSPHPSLLAPMEGQTTEDIAQFAVTEAEVAARKRTAKTSKGQRLFEFAVDVAAAPPDSIYSHTKLVTLKPKYIIENQTGLPIDVKQLDAKDPEGDTPLPISSRFARTLAPGQRAAVYWDDADLPKKLLIRPRPPGESPDSWHWSGGFPIPDTEWYFGLRIRQARGGKGYMNIPVNVTVGSSGSVQVTLKNPASVPPYRIENGCKDVQLFFVQVPMVFQKHGSLYIDSLQPGGAMPYAWDEPTELTKLRVQAKVVGRSSEGKVSDFVLDTLGDAAMMMLPTHSEGDASKRRDKAGRLYRTLSNEVPEELKKKLVSLLAAEFSKKVYVTVYADGPTRVLRFSDEKNISSLEQQHVVLDLAARMKQVENQLRAVNAQFARLSGVSGAHAWSLDLYGRMPAAKDEPQAQRSSLQRRASRKVPLPEATQALVQYASRHLPSVTTLARQARGTTSSRDLSESPSGLIPLPARGSGGGIGIGGGIDTSPPQSSFPTTATAVREKEKERVRFGRSVSFADDAAAVRFRTASSSAGPPLPGVLHIDDSTDLPYRHLVIRTGSEVVQPPPRLPVSEDPANEIQPFIEDITDGASGSRVPPVAAGGGVGGAGGVGGISRHRRNNSGTSRDWGHITTDPLQGAAGTRGLGATKTASTVTAALGGGGGGTLNGGGPSNAGKRDSTASTAANNNNINTTNNNSGAITAATLARRQELLRLMSDGDAVLLVGGDLTVTVVQAKHLSGFPHSTHPFARVRVQDPVPPSSDGAPEERTKQTSVVWQSADPVWDEQLMFRDVCAASELIIELWDLGGSRSGEQLNALVTNPHEVLKSCRYLGGAEVALGETLDAPPGTPLWFPLMRRSAGDTVSGQLQLRFQWDVSARGLLSIKLSALERVLAQRREILAALQPIPARTALEWSKPTQEAITNSTGAMSSPTSATAAAGRGGNEFPSSPTKGGGGGGGGGGTPTAASFDLFGLGGDSTVLGGIGPIAHPSKIAAEVLARHSMEHNRRHLVVTVLEARGVNPRRGVVVALSASELPCPAVTLTVPGYPPYCTTAMPHTLTPRWPADQRHIFKGVDPANSEVQVKAWDQRGGVLHRKVTLGQGMVHASHVRGENPVYVWVPLARPGQGGVAPGEIDSGNELQVFLRLQWQTEVERGSSLKVEVDAAGAGLMVVGGLQDELFNFTVDSAKVTAVRTRLELQVEGSVAKVQLDNQMLNAVEPVVLAPDVGVRPTGATVEGPLLQFGFTRSYAGSAATAGPSDIIQAAAAELAEAENGGVSGGGISGGGDDDDDDDTSVSGRSGPSSIPASASTSALDLAGLAGSTPPQTASAASINAIGTGTTTTTAPHSDSRGIRSFKKIRFTVAPLDLMTDEAFLEALLSFVSSLPTSDIWQDRPWQEQQRRLLTAQFGPREVEGLAVNAVVVPQAPPTAAGIAAGTGGLPPSTSSISLVDHGRGGGAAGDNSAMSALGWVLEKEARDLEALHGQSDLSSWFFLESAEISTVSVNVTVSLTSRLLSAGQQLTAQGASGAFNRALGASGFQLVNVSNEPITLGRWVAGNDPSIRGRFSNGFLSQRALASNLARHYYRESLKEAHKVLGGAGPAVAAVPLTVLWASGSAVALLREVTSGNVGVVGTIQQALYVPLMTFSMLAGGFSKTFAAMMAGMPPYRDGADDQTIRRIIKRPNNALEALTGAPRELVLGVHNALTGMLMDPAAGWHELHALGFSIGVIKALIGLPVRPFIGSMEFTSKVFAALALSSLGRDGIVGKIQRRVRAPGAYADDGSDAMMEDGPRSEAQAQSRALQAAWQRVLPEFFPEMAEDTVTEVINVRATRVVLVTDRHVAYLRARHAREHSVYKAKWLVPAAEVQNIRGDPESRKITITHVHRYDLKVFGVWPVQKRKGLRCGSRAAYERTILRLTKVQQAMQGGGAVVEEGSAGGEFVGANMEELTILSAPYRSPEALAMVRSSSPGGGGGVNAVGEGYQGQLGPPLPNVQQRRRRQMLVD